LELRESLELNLEWGWKEAAKGKGRVQRELGCESFFMCTNGGAVTGWRHLLKAHPWLGLRL